MLLTNDLLHWADFVKEIFQIVVKAVNINSITAKEYPINEGIQRNLECKRRTDFSVLLT